MVLGAQQMRNFFPFTAIRKQNFLAFPCFWFGTVSGKVLGGSFFQAAFFRISHRSKQFHDAFREATKVFWSKKIDSG